MLLEVYNPCTVFITSSSTHVYRMREVVYAARMYRDAKRARHMAVPDAIQAICDVDVDTINRTLVHGPDEPPWIRLFDMGSP